MSGTAGSTVLLLESSSGEKIYRHPDSIVVLLPDGRDTITSSWVNGGYRKDLKAIFNHQISKGVKAVDDLEGGSISDYVSIVSERLGLEPEYSSAMLTAANMDNVAIISHSFRGVEVTAIVTAGIVINGGRVGDPASYHEEKGTHMYIQGTINTILLIGASLPEYAMARAIITALKQRPQPCNN